MVTTTVPDENGTQHLYSLVDSGGFLMPVVVQNTACHPKQGDGTVLSISKAVEERSPVPGGADGFGQQASKMRRELFIPSS